MREHDHFLSNTNLDIALQGEYDLLLVVLSYLVASLAGFCALSIIRFIQSNESIRFPILIFGGITLGLGIWSMHFTGMLAFSLPTPILYDPGITLFSVLPAILASIIFLHNLAKANLSTIAVLFTGLLLAFGIATMHFTGMAAMSMKAYMSHDPYLYVFAIISSWVLAVLTIALKSNKVSLKNLNKNHHLLLCGLTFGFSVASMHYLAMSSTYFFPDNSVEPTGIGNDILAFGLVGSAVLLMILLILFLFYKNKIDGLLKLASTHHQRVIETIDNMQDGFILSNDDGQILLVNKKFQSIFNDNKTNIFSSKQNISELYQHLAHHYFKFDNLTETQKMLDIVTSRTNLAESLNVIDKENRWWQLRQNRTSADTVIQTWTDVTKQIIQERELVLAKNSALATLKDLRDTQEELLETQKMASLGGLVTGVAHELNTPLGVGITSLSSIMEIIDKVKLSLASGIIKKSELESALKSVSDFEELAYKNLNRMAKLIQQFKYISVDQDVEITKQFSLSNALEDLQTLWKSALNDKQLNIAINLQEDIKVISFENALTQVLSCLISNSIEHAFEKCEQGKIEISAKIEDQRLLLRYCDNGCGIDQNISNRVFEPFVTTKRNEGGIGLGLHIAYNIVCQKLKGKIKLTSPTPEYNTIFTINLPVDCSQPPKPPTTTG